MLCPVRLNLSVRGFSNSLCVHFHSWTVSDVHTACRQMGFDGGKWWAWLDRQTGQPQPRLLLEAPGCTGPEASVQECPQWGSRQMGAGVCGEFTFIFTKS